MLIVDIATIWVLLKPSSTTHVHLQNLAADDDGGHAAAATGAGSTQAADKAGLLEYIRER